MISLSPFYTLYKSTNVIQSSFFNSHFSQSFNNIIYASTKKHLTLISKSFTSHTLSSAIKLNFEQNCLLKEGFVYIPNTPIGGQLISNHSSKFLSDCGNITITGCAFNDCQSTTPGGAIDIEQDCFVIIHNTIFNNCNTKANAGGSCFIARKYVSGPPNFNDEQLEEMDIQYCCFQNCKGNSELYGVAIFSAAKVSILYYASTVNCPGQESNKVKGAQFDLQAENATSQDVNATGSNAEWCGGIEYRGATSGFFRYQTISQMTCMFAVSYTNIGTKNLNLYESNIFKITLRRASVSDTDKVYSGLIHVRYTDGHDANDITLTRFCFIDNVFGTNKNDYSSIVSRGTSRECDGICKYKITLDNCFYSCQNDKVAYISDDYFNYLVTKECVQTTSTLNNIPQLSLGECRGEVTAAPLTPSPTNRFSESNHFSHSNKFTESNHLTNSKSFSFSDEFSKSLVFTNSVAFTQENKNEGGKNKVPLIAGLSSAAAAVAVAGGLAAFFLIKKNHPIKDEELETIKDTQNTINGENPIYDNKAEDDPFKDDFVNN